MESDGEENSMAGPGQATYRGDDAAKIDIGIILLAGDARGRGNRRACGPNLERGRAVYRGQYLTCAVPICADMRLAMQ